MEIIVVDDGSTDDTRQVLAKYGSIIQYQYQKNAGRSEARNTGIGLAKGDYIAFLDDDDLWLPDKIKRQAAFLDANADIGLVHSFMQIIDDCGKLLDRETKSLRMLYQKALKSGYTYEAMSHLCPLFSSSVMLRRQCLESCGYFDKDIEAFEDWDFYLRFARDYRIGTIPESLVSYRKHPTQSNREELARGRVKTSLKHLGLSNRFLNNQVRANFYMHLAQAYYIMADIGHFQEYAMKALRLDLKNLFRSRLSMHLLMSLLPAGIIREKRRIFK